MILQYPERDDEKRILKLAYGSDSVKIHPNMK